MIRTPASCPAELAEYRMALLCKVEWKTNKVLGGLFVSVFQHKA